MTSAPVFFAQRSLRFLRLNFLRENDTPRAILRCGLRELRSAPLALGPDRRSRFFDPKVRVMPRRLLTWRGKSGHRRAGCCASCKASAGVAHQSAATESVTENIPPRGQLRGKGEKVG